MVTAAGPAAAVTVVAVAWALRHTTLWWTAGRALSLVGARQAAGRPAPSILRRALARAGVDIDGWVALRLWAVALAVSVALALVARGGPVVVVVTLIGPPGALLAARGRSARIRQRQLPVALDAVAAGLRGGEALRTALEAASAAGGPVGDELARVTSHAAAGRSLAAALTDWAASADDHGTRLAGAALAVAAEVGGPGADAVDAAAASLRDRAAAEDEVAALSVQARLSAALLTVAPLAFAFLLTTLDPPSARFLFGTRAGWACIAVGLTLDLLGGWWMMRLVRRSR